MSVIVYFGLISIICCIRVQEVVSKSETEDNLIGTRILGEQDSSAGVVVVVRQELFNYATKVGVQYLEADVKQLQLPQFYRRLQLPFLGTIKVHVHNLTISKFQVDQSKTDVLIKNDQFHVQVSNLQTQLDFFWSYRIACISGQGHGSLALKNGQLNMHFKLSNEEESAPQMLVSSAETEFEEVVIELEAEENNWFYQTLLGLSQNWIDNQIAQGIDRALKQDFPRAINQVLTSLPSDLNVTDIPVQIHVHYAFQTLNFFAAEAYDTVIAILGSGDEAQENGDNKLVCPYDTFPLDESPSSIASDAHMMTILSHESVLNCLLWGLQLDKRLDQIVKQGDIPNFDMWTVIFQSFVPGIYQVYPGKYVQLNIVQKQAPFISFQPGNRPISFNMQFYQDIFVVLTGETASSSKDLVYICRMFANITVHMDVQWNDVTINKDDIDVTYEVVDSPRFHPQPDQFEASIVFLLTQKQAMARLALGEIINTYVKSKIMQQVDVSNALVEGFREGWLGVSANIGLNETNLFNNMALFGEEQNIQDSYQLFSSLYQQKTVNNEAYVDFGALMEKFIRNIGTAQDSILQQ